MFLFEFCYKIITFDIVSSAYKLNQIFSAYFSAQCLLSIENTIISGF